MQNQARNRKARELSTKSTAKIIVALKITFSAPRLVVCMAVLLLMLPAEKPEVLFCIRMENISKKEIIS